MFKPEKIKELNELEMLVYNYIVANLDQVHHMTIRELSNACHVSTSTILRCCNKLGMHGFSELKYVIQHELDAQQNQDYDQYYKTMIQVDYFLKSVNNESYRKVIEPAIQMILKAGQVAFFGTGTSGILGWYGSRYFNNYGLNAYCVLDPFTPVPPQGLENTLAIILSVSGETRETVRQTEDLRRYGATILSITNDENSTVARMADHNLSYFMPEMKHTTIETVNLTTQVPLIALLEILAQQVAQKM